jgi:purine-binding chemotaxis protein CheW
MPRKKQTTKNKKINKIATFAVSPLVDEPVFDSPMAPEMDMNVNKGKKDVISEVSKKTRRREEEIVPTEQLITFELDKEEYASIITDLREIIKIPEITPVPGSPVYIRGVLNLRGQIVVVIDLEKKFELKREHKINPNHIVIAEIDDNIFGIIVDEVTGVVRVPISSIKTTPSLVASKIHTDYLRGVVILDKEEDQKVKSKKGDDKIKVKNMDELASRLILLLDIPKMLAEKELLEFGAAVKETAQQTQKVE